jgi:hypothetical protein
MHAGRIKHIDRPRVENLWITEIIMVHSENHRKPINTLCGQNAEIMNVKVGGTYSKYCASKG